MKKLLVFIIIIIITTLQALADDGVKYEIQIKTDNDFFVPFGNTDKYYTYGQKFFYRNRIDNTNGFFLSLDRIFNSRGSIKIIEFELGQEAYTPGNFINNDFNQFDRPFAGWLYIGSYISSITDNKIIKIGVEIGVIGPASYAGKVQNFFHENISGGEILEEWQYQINNNIGFNFKAEYNRPIINQKYVDLTFENKLALGTQAVYYQGGGRIRIGRFNPMSSSIAYNTSISGKKFKSEFFIDFTSNLKFIGYNATLKQSEDQKVFFLNKQVNNLLPTYSASINFNTRHVGANLSYYFNGGDLITLDPHRYGSINLFFRC